MTLSSGAPSLCLVLFQHPPQTHSSKHCDGPLRVGVWTMDLEEEPVIDFPGILRRLALQQPGRLARAICIPDTVD